MTVSHDQWLASIIDAASHIANREYQEEAWFPGGKYRSSPDEIYLTLMEDSLFDRFYEKYGATFNEQQTRTWKELRQRLDKYYDKLPKRPDPRVVLNDPEWEQVRQVASKFVEAFTKSRNG